MLTSPQPEIILKTSIIQPSRYQDYYQTIDELIIQNFTNEEINILRSDPLYFNVKGLLGDDKILKTRLLSDIIDSELNYKEEISYMKNNIILQSRKTILTYILTYTYIIYLITKLL